VSRGLGARLAFVLSHARLELGSVPLTSARDEVATLDVHDDDTREPIRGQ
jgi:hypothetical protein